MNCSPRLVGEIFDAQESDSALKDKFATADRTAECLVGNIERDSDFIQQFWRAKKRILKDQFGIDWKTPAELNRRIAYDSYGQPKITDAELRALRTLASARLSSSSEQVRDIERSFDGVASVWTRDRQTQRIREYRFEGHDAAWTFIKVTEWVE